MEISDNFVQNWNKNIQTHFSGRSVFIEFIFSDWKTVALFISITYTNTHANTCEYIQNSTATDEGGGEESQSG